MGWKNLIFNPHTPLAQPMHHYFWPQMCELKVQWNMMERIMIHNGHHKHMLLLLYVRQK